MGFITSLYFLVTAFEGIVDVISDRKLNSDLESNTHYAVLVLRSGKKQFNAKHKSAQRVALLA